MQKIGEKDIEDPRNVLDTKRALTVIKTASGFRYISGIVEELSNALLLRPAVTPVLAILKNVEAKKRRQFRSGSVLDFVLSSL